MKNQFLTKQVTNDLQVILIPDKDHEFLMASKQVAKGYGICPTTLRTQKHRHQDELIEGKHFISNVPVGNAKGRGGNITTLWTKRGIIRLGFYLESKRAKLFRDWVEDLVINMLERKLPVLPDAPRRNHNRLTQDRVVDILCDICLVSDNDLRVRLMNKLIG